MKKRVKLLQLGILLIVSLFVVILANNSFSKYTMSQDDHLTGTYVDFRLSHDGDGQVALMSEVKKATNEGSTEENTATDANKVQIEYTGYIPLSVINKKDNKVSQRELAFTLRAPTDTELQEGKIVDIWGKTFEFSENDKSEFYEIQIVKANGSAYTDEEKVDANGEYIQNTSFEAAKEKESHLTLQINRLKKSRRKDHSSVQPGTLSDVEEITVVLETSAPYKTTQVFKIRVSNSLVFMNTTKTTYFGFTDVKVNILTAKKYVFQNNNATETHSEESTYPAKIEILYDDYSIFDFERFRLEVENQYTNVGSGVTKVGYEYETGNRNIILNVPAGSSINLHFYISEKKAVISETTNFIYGSTGASTYDYTTKVAGVKNYQDELKYVYHHLLDE